MSRLPHGLAALGATSDPVHLVCYCGKRLDTVVYSESLRATTLRHHVRRGGVTGHGGAYRWAWDCRRCGATPTLRHDTLQREHARAVAEGTEILFGIHV